MQKLGFSQGWIDLVMRCEESGTFSFLLNAEPTGFAKPLRGLRQGDPISPYLFLLCAEDLSYLLSSAMERRMSFGHHICPEAPIISHRLFADDTIISYKAYEAQAKVLKNILDTYEASSGQQINCDKTQVMFSKGTPQSIKENILIIFDIREVLSHDKYLGLPTRVGRSKKKLFLHIKD